MNKTIHVIFDNSGSMAEYAKMHVQHNAARTLITMKQLYADLFSNIEFAFFTVNDNLTSITRNDNGMFKFSKPEGNCDISLISDLIMQIRNRSQDQKISLIFFSDGIFNRSERKKFTEKFKEAKWLYVQCVGIGIDKDSIALKELSSSNKIETVDNIYAIVEDAISFFVSSNKKPLSLENIKKEEML